MTRNNYPSSSSISRRTCATILSPRVSPASFVGLPDRKVDAGKQERVSFVMRRLLRPAANSHRERPEDAAYWDEYAWVKTSAGYAWQRVRNPTQSKRRDPAGR